MANKNALTAVKFVPSTSSSQLEVQRQDSENLLGNILIGAKLKHARKLLRLRLKDVAASVGCSESMLSKVENDQVKPSLKILHRLVTELNISIGILFSNIDYASRVVMRRHERRVIRTSVIGRPSADGVRLECIVPDPANRLLYGSIHIVEPGGGSGGHIEHMGEEIGYILTGELLLTVDGTQYHLYSGDSFFFDSSLPHGYTNPGEIICKVIWINTPPTF